MLPTVGPGARGPGRHTFYDVCRQNGLLDGLQYVIDATDLRSYAASLAAGDGPLGDLTGQAAKLALGPAGASNPTLISSGGRRRRARAYWSLATFSARISAPMAAWSQTLHKDNAKYTWAAWRKVNASDAAFGHGFVNTVDNSSIGWSVGLGPAAALDKITITQGSGGGGGSNIVGPVTTFGAWNFYAASYDEASGAFIFQFNAAQTTGTQVYVTPTASNSAGSASSGLIDVYDGGDGGAAVRADAMWVGRNLTAAELSTLYTKSQPYFSVS